VGPTLIIIEKGNSTSWERKLNYRAEQRKGKKSQNDIGHSQWNRNIGNIEQKEGAYEKVGSHWSSIWQYRNA